jgi:hypothetical protein
MCLHRQILPVHLFRTRIWLSKRVVKHVWYVHQILEESVFTVKFVFETDEANLNKKLDCIHIFILCS